MYFIFTRLYDKFQCLKLEEVITKNLQNKRKYEKSPKKEEGWDDKHVYFFYSALHSKKLGSDIFNSIHVGLHSENKKLRRGV